jgi:hypothetical protein
MPTPRLAVDSRGGEPRFPLVSTWHSSPWAGFDRIDSAVRQSDLATEWIQWMRTSMIDWSKAFAGAFPYEPFLDRHANASQRARWDAMHTRFALSAEQRELLAGFGRRMPVLCLAGAWCGDCINQCPAFAHFAQASTQIDLRFLDRDVNPLIRDTLSVNGGQRVPVVVFLSEDWFEVARYGERTLSIYRRMAAEQLGPACPTGFIPPANEAIAAITADWLAEFERAQLILRLSPRLRAAHGD